MEEEEKSSMELQSLFQETEDEQNYKPVNYLDKIKGFVIATAYVSALALSATCCQLIERRIPDYELNTIRLLTAFYRVASLCHTL